MTRYVSIREASAILGIKVRTVREWIKQGKLTAEKDAVSKRWKVQVSEDVDEDKD